LPARLASWTPVRYVSTEIVSAGHRAIPRMLSARTPARVASEKLLGTQGREAPVAASRPECRYSTDSALRLGGPRASSGPDGRAARDCPGHANRASPRSHA
jgi:hypothetical protein